MRNCFGRECRGRSITPEGISFGISSRIFGMYVNLTANHCSANQSISQSLFSHFLLQCEREQKSTSQSLFSHFLLQCEREQKSTSQSLFSHFLLQCEREQKSTSHFNAKRICSIVNVSRRCQNAAGHYPNK